MKSFTDKINEEANFPSQFDIGDPVYVTIQGHELEGNVRHVGFTNGKVRYAISLTTDEGEEGRTTFHNIDSVFVTPRQGEKIEFEFDNYS